MKSQFQILSFLSNYTPKTDLDRQFIESFLVQRFQITPKTPRFAPNFDGKPLDVESFIRWLESGSEALKIAFYENRCVLLGNCTLETCDIIGTLLPDNSIDTTKITVPADQISNASEEAQQSFKLALLENNLQPNPDTMQLVPKFTPAQENRVVFYDFAQNIQGVGVVREVTAEGNVIFFCYFTYPTQSQPKRIGYNLHEDPVYTLQSFIFESIDKENVQTTLGNSTSCFRRLGRELERAGKIWKDKLLRIEPIELELKEGAKYSYINEKMCAVIETEKGTSISRNRYLAGNYFTDPKAAIKMAGRFKEMLREYLASDKWPELKD